MAKKGGSAPKPPNPQQTIAAQTASNLQTARTEAELNRYNVNSPFGGVQWTNNGGDRWTQTVTESPAQRALREQEERLGLSTGNLAQGQVDRLGGILDRPYESRRLGIADALGDYGSDVEQRTYDLATRRLGQEFDRGEESLRSRLAAQGINAGSDAFGAELRDFNNARGDAYANAQLMARQQGQSDRSQALSELLTQYGADTSADTANRSTPIQEVGYLAGLGQYTPINPGQGFMANLQPTDVAGIINQGYQNRLGAYNAQQSARGSTLGALANLGAAGITAWSDVRLKRDVEYSHTDANGLRWWTYRYLWDDDALPKRLGVMAQEAPAHAVRPHESGYLMVDYGAL